MTKHNLTTFISILCCAALLQASALTLRASAHDREELSSHAQRTQSFQLYQMRSERDSIRKGGPIAGVVFSSLAIVIGVPVMAIGISALGDTEPAPTYGVDYDPFACLPYGCDSGFTHAEARNTAIVGAIITGAGIIGLAFSAKAIHRRNDRS